MERRDKNPILRLLTALLAATLLLTACQTQTPETETVPDPPPEVQEPQGTPSTETENLVKLCKVWGYTKYMHPAFLLGQKDWDEELLVLIPQVREMTTAEEVNALLHDWFVGLGEIDYGPTARPAQEWSNVAEEDKIFRANTAWTADTTYLSEALATDLSQLGEIPRILRSSAPVSFAVTNQWGRGEPVNYPIFNNEKTYPDMDYANDNYRLLALFRLWNGMEYFFPYLGLMDRDWGDCLTESIPAMLSGDDQLSYDRTIAQLAAQLHDGHVSSDRFYYDSDWASFLPVSVSAAEGRLVVTSSADGCPLEAGDILLKIEGSTIEERAKEIMPYISIPRDEIFLGSTGGRAMLTAFHGASADVTVLRGGEEQTFSVTGASAPELIPFWFSVEAGSHQLLEGNIGLINPALLPASQGPGVMERFQNTDGLIVDLRQYPYDAELAWLTAYLLEETVTGYYYAGPSEAVPGAYINYPIKWGGAADAGAQTYHYDKPVVVIISADTSSAGENYTMALRQNDQVVLLGENTSGTNGIRAELPLPCGKVFTFSSQEAADAGGCVTQRTGIAPDIRVDPTIQGTAEGRDEVLEAAVQYILEKGEER